MTQTINGHFTCDNSYAVYKGTEVSVTQLFHEHTNVDASEIWSGEDVLFSADEGDYLYIIAWSDDKTYQGLIGTFSSQVKTVNTGDPGWQVLPTGLNKGNNEFPTVAEINQYIGNASPGDWKVPFVGARNNPPEGKPYTTAINQIPDDARWIWYDSGKDSNAKYPVSPYVPFNAFNHDEFLIFRIPIAKFNPPVNNDNNHPSGCQQNIVVNCCKEEEETPVVLPAEIKEKCCGTCVFEVRFQRWRYVSGKPGFLDGAAEISFVSHVDGNMHNYPSANGSYVKLMKRGGDFPKGWRAANVRVAVFEVSCDVPAYKEIMTEMIENPQKEEGFSAMLEGGRPWGASDVDTVKLKCGEKVDPISQTVKLEHGGNAKEDMKLEVEYRFSQVTACSCCGSEKGL